MNTVYVSVDDKGLFIRKGASMFRPTNPADTGGLKPRATTRAWTGAECPSNALNVDTPKGLRQWQKS